MIKSIIDPNSLRKFKALVAGVNRIIITCHKKADGDAIGSSLGMCQLLRNMGKNAIVIIPDQLPDSLAFVAKGIDYVTFSLNEVKATNIIRNTQLILSLDYNTFSRVDRMQPWLEESKLPKVLIDHHLDPSPAFDVVMSYPKLSSTSELVFRLTPKSMR